MIVRSKRSERFTTVQNAVIEDPSIDWRDLGLLVYLLSKPDHWEVSPAHLATVRKSGRDAVYNSLKRLREAGYVKVEKKGDGTTNWIVFDNPNTEKPDKDEETQIRVFPITEKPTLVKTDKKLVKTEVRAAARIPENWQPDEKSVAWITSFGVTLEQAKPAITNFVDYWSSRSTRRKDWDRTFRNNGVVESFLLKARKHETPKHVYRSKAEAAHEQLKEVANAARVGSKDIRETSGEVWPQVDQFLPGRRDADVSPGGMGRDPWDCDSGGSEAGPGYLEQRLAADSARVSEGLPLWAGEPHRIHDFPEAENVEARSPGGYTKTSRRH